LRRFSRTSLLGTLLVPLLAAGCSGSSASPTAAAVATASPTAAAAASTTAPSEAAASSASPPAAAAAPSACPSAAAASSGSGTQTIDYLAPTLMDDYQSAATQTLSKLGPDYGYAVKVLNANNQVSTQVTQMDDAVSQKPAAIVLNAVDPSGLTGAVQKARAAGVPVIALDREIGDTTVDFTSEIGTIKLGQIAADQIAQLLLKKNGSETGNVLEVMGDAGDSYTVYIDKGFQSEIAQYPNIHVVAKPTPGYDQVKAASVVDDQLTAGKVDLILVHSDFRITAIVPVLQQHGFKPGDIPIVGTDGASSALQAIRDGWAVETIGIPLVAEVAGSLMYLPQILAKAPIPTGSCEVNGVQADISMQKFGPALYVPGQVVDKTSVDDPSLWGNAKH
jgi:ribose transport system substrate-binding protein